MEKILIFESKAEAEKVVHLNQIRKISIGDETLCLANTREGFVAFDTDCPHLGDDLSKGTINNQMEVVCPWHSYRFHLKTGLSNRNCSDLKLYNLIWEDEKLYIEC